MRYDQTMTMPALEPISVDEFLDWESDDGHSYELRDGLVVAMAPTKPGHQILTARLARYLDEALDDRPSCSVRAEAAIVVTGRDGVVHHADLAVTCREHEPEQRHTPDPVVIVEILSPSTETYDRRVKLPDYRAIPSVEEIVLIAQDQLYCEVHRRFESDRWQTDLLQTPEAELRLMSIGFAQPLSVLYRKVAVERP
ncbi:MAG: Uma2 family endonuclease [bacterium]|nr:Uma2 family endonuclease [bacterium]